MHHSAFLFYRGVEGTWRNSCETRVHPRPRRVHHGAGEGTQLAPHRVIRIRRRHDSNVAKVASNAEIVRAGALSQ